MSVSVGHGLPATAPAPFAPSLRTRLSDFAALTKPRITLMNLVPMLAGSWLAAHHTVTPVPASRVVAAVAGTALVVASANALNMYIERSSDGLMARTRGRPLPAGRMAPNLALVFGLGLGAAALPLLALCVNLATGALAAFALVMYVAVYTPLKRHTHHALLVGAIPGAVPPLLGWSAVTGRFELPGLLLFGILFLWQVPHFLAIATFRRDDYARAGMQVMTIARSQRSTRLHIVAYLAALVGVSLALLATGVGGALYAGSAALLGAGFFGVGAMGLRPTAGVAWARKLFAVSIGYLVLLILALVASP